MLSLRWIGFLVLALAGVTTPAWAEIQLDAIWSEGAVFAANRPALVRGWASPGARLTFVPSWGETLTQTVPASGRFAVQLGAAEPGGPHSLAVSGDGDVVLEGLLSGALWLASGQSNMDYPVGAVAEDSQYFDPFQVDPQLRYFRVDEGAAAQPVQDIAGAWQSCDLEAPDRFSAVAHAFARRLRAELKMPVGIVQAAVGATPIAAWTRLEALRDIEGFGAEHRLDPDRLDKTQAGALWNAMLAPLAGHRFDGVIWYQGEHDRLEYGRYGPRFQALIADWRRAFRDAQLPFLFVQIAPYEYEGDLGELPRLREAQDAALELAGTARTVILDLGDPVDIHPERKREVGERLAAQALVHAYDRGVPGLSVNGPEVRGAVFRPYGARVDYLPGIAELLTRERPAIVGGVAGFQLAGEDRRFHPASAVISGTSVHLECDLVPAPVAVRYAFERGDGGNLCDANGLPANAWRSDDWPILPPDGALEGEALSLSTWRAPFASPMTWTESGDVIRGTGAPAGLLVSERSYRNYELELDWRHLTPGGDSGLFVAADPIPAIGSPFCRGVEIQLEDGPSGPVASTHGDILIRPGAALQPSQLEAPIQRLRPTVLRQQPAPHWNHLRIRMVEGQLDVWMNGVHTNTATGIEPAGGFLGLQSNGSPIEFRRIRILERPAGTAEFPPSEFPWRWPLALYRGDSLGPIFEPRAGNSDWSAEGSEIHGGGNGPLRSALRLEELTESLPSGSNPVNLELSMDFRRADPTAGPAVLLEGLESFFEELFATGLERGGQWNRLVVRFGRPVDSGGLVEPARTCEVRLNGELIFEQRSTRPERADGSEPPIEEGALSFWTESRGWDLGHLVFEAYDSSLELTNLVLNVGG